MRQNEHQNLDWEGGGEKGVHRKNTMKLRDKLESVHACLLLLLDNSNPR